MHDAPGSLPVLAYRQGPAFHTVPARQEGWLCKCSAYEEQA